MMPWLVYALQLTAFDAAATLPAGWMSGVTGQGDARWEVVRDSSAPSHPNVLRQSGQATFCWAVDTREKFSNGFVEVKIRPESGAEDQAGGIVWRFKDANNYYIARMNALEGNVVAYKTIDGRRSSLRVKGRMFGYGVDVPVSAGKWHLLRVEFKDSTFTVYFEGSKLFEVEDGTLAGAGAVGLWTKADSVTSFDDFKSSAK